MDKAPFLVPSYLHNLGYLEEPAIIEAAEIAIEITPDQINYKAAWSQWRGIFEYLACVEHATAQLLKISSGIIDTNVIIPSQYNSASLIFFAQATLDTLAVWTKGRLNLTSKGSNCAFHKQPFKNEIEVKALNLWKVVKHYEPYLSNLENYRQYWIHRHHGGAKIYCDRKPSDPGAIPLLLVPLNPAINLDVQSGKDYLQTIEATRKANKGEWLIPMSDFALQKATGLKSFVLDYLGQAILCPELL